MESSWSEGWRRRNPRNVDLRFFFSDSDGESGSGLFRSELEAIVGILGGVRGAVESMLIRFDVAQYADCSDVRACSCCRLAELGMLNHNSPSLRGRLNPSWWYAIGSAFSSCGALMLTCSNSKFGAANDFAGDDQFLGLKLANVFGIVSNWASGSILKGAVVVCSSAFKTGADLSMRRDKQARQVQELSCVVCGS